MAPDPTTQYLMMMHQFYLRQFLILNRNLRLNKKGTSDTAPYTSQKSTRQWSE